MKKTQIEHDVEITEVSARIPYYSSVSPATAVAMAYPGLKMELRICPPFVRIFSRTLLIPPMFRSVFHDTICFI